MFQRIIHRLFRRRHYWRTVSFDEIAELYASRLMTTFAINIVNLFAAVYLYELGYSIVFIALFYAGWYLFKIPFSVLAARYTAYYGPKHAILLANILRIPSLVAFAFASDQGLIAVLIFGMFQQMSAAMYDIGYLVDFSKVKHSDHAGKEIGTMQVMEKAAKIISPLVGGVIAAVYSPQITIIVAGIVFALAALPLLRTIEPTATRIKLKIAGFPWRHAWQSLLSQSVVGFDFVTSGMVWTLFIMLFIFSSLGPDVYAALGGLASLGVFVSMVAAWTFGQIVDKHKGGVLLTAGTIANTVIHLFRPFTLTTTGVLGVNIASETATSAYAMPFTRVIFDIADSYGYRIVYVMFIEMAVNLGAAAACIVLALSVHTLGVEQGMKLTFFAAAAYELILLISRRAAR